MTITSKQSPVSFLTRVPEIMFRGEDKGAESAVGFEEVRGLGGGKECQPGVRHALLTFGVAMSRRGTPNPKPTWPSDDFTF